MKLDGALQESNSRMAEWDALISFPPEKFLLSRSLPRATPAEIFKGYNAFT